MNKCILFIFRHVVLLSCSVNYQLAADFQNPSIHGHCCPPAVQWTAEFYDHHAGKFWTTTQEFWTTTQNFIFWTMLT